ncbi:flagellar basal body L-ring protein FlgH [Burkholderia stagnalis]|uniref:flagellar basal body L-ring protein FlgH n=1 Tax=Burkholderia stagnalis TaxID=1503054 RepID=UPI000F5FF9C6|nr:flagellar basal body L-ring protein FlgH [Burkholderia stagnalis]RQX94968.1 flagellar basal body L-ring protein FlgH [Burkholderia stagnalis]RQY14933.1 flagellar basal body L-ring protein FlgH [Burkholderia stagnalis]RQY32520.1 flagellar basal body L-ring protein FlgH [Burkholderia stagnalis]RQY49595.1 flagellar basal body L-ring protein FlgH [Burkholderia stagnalis]RQY56608.1 flagellar basal body L-ring protein FlgH [Burkholderia stagnalis]
MLHRIAFALCVGLVALLLASGSAAAADLYQDSAYRSLTSDRRASRTGDIVTVLVYESSTASNTADTSTKTNVGVQGSITTQYAGQNAAQIGLGDNYGGKGQIQRTGRLLAQLSAHVIDVTAAGDLLVTGTQEIDVNGEKTQIRVEGRVRPVDIAANNTVLSTRLADAKIDYVGEGFITDRSRPGLIPRFLAWLGLW